MAGAPPGCQLVGRGRASWMRGWPPGRRTNRRMRGVAHLAGSGASAPARAGFGCARRRAEAARPSSRQPAARPGFWQKLLGQPAFSKAYAVICGSRPEQRLRLVSLGQHPGYTLNVATDAGETRQLDLPDGSHVALNFNSTLQVRYYPRRRELVLNQGEGYFDVAPDARRPSPWMRAKAASPWSARPSTCAMRRMKSSSGLARPRAGAARPRQSRRRADADRGRRPGRRYSQSQLPSRVGVAGERGRLAQRTAGLPAHAAGRSGPGGCAVRRQARVAGQPGLKSLPVSGFAATNAPATFLEALPDLLPVQVKRTADGGYLIWLADGGRQPSFFQRGSQSCPEIRLPLQGRYRSIRSTKMEQEWDGKLERRVDQRRVEHGHGVKACRCWWQGR